MKAHTAEKFKRIIKVKSDLLSKLKPLNKNAEQRSVPTYPPSQASHKHHLPAKHKQHHHHYHRLKPAVPPLRPNELSVSTPSLGPAGHNYRNAFTGRHWHQRFSETQTADALLAEGFERLECTSEQQHERLSNGVTPPRLCPPLEPYLSFLFTFFSLSIFVFYFVFYFFSIFVFFLSFFLFPFFLCGCSLCQLMFNTLLVSLLGSSFHQAHTYPNSFPNGFAKSRTATSIQRYCPTSFDRLLWTLYDPLDSACNFFISLRHFSCCSFIESA
jgi:hypothetical protein